MKLPILKRQFSLTTMTIAIASCLTAFTSVNSVLAQAKKGFYCDVDSSVPTTVYQNARGSSEPWIQWVSDHFTDANWTPSARCQAVSERLEQYRQEGKLKYVTLGVENDQQVICVAEEDNGPCKGIVYTLKPGQDGVAALNNLFAWGSGQQNLESSYESSTTVPYINVGDRLGDLDN